MKIIIKNKSELPIYEQIEEQIKSQIIDGSIREDEQLPSIRQLARDLKISVITTTRVYNDLADEVADVIQAACNLASRYGLDVAAAMVRCEERNRARGRYCDGKMPSATDVMSPGAKEIFDRMVRAAYE